jgi:hypothetical protein
MITPYIPDELFEVNTNAKIKFEDDVIIIDDYYKNYGDMHNVLTNMYVPRWKWSKQGRNFKDYYDCRPLLSNRESNKNESLTDLIYDLYKEHKPIRIFNPSIHDFNYLKHIQNIPDNNKQFYPHADTPYASIIYLDKICSGGTAFYDIQELDNKEHEALFFDVSGFNKKIINAKPNRHIIFRGDQYHGGYIEDHNKYVKDWRINQVIFYNYASKN